jgi:hypothetical protein
VNALVLDGEQAFIQAIIRGENPFNPVSNIQETDQVFDNNITWSSLVSEIGANDKTIENTNSENLINEPVVRLAVRKRTKEIAAEFGLDEDEISSKILSDCFDSVPKQCSLLQVINFVKNYSEMSFLECDNCGATNRPAWTICHDCGYVNSN